jgi:hypothetical protein
MNDPLTYFIVNRPLYTKALLNNSKEDGWQMKHLSESSEETPDDLSEPMKVCANY